MRDFFLVKYEILCNTMDMVYMDAVREPKSVEFLQGVPACENVSHKHTYVLLMLDRSWDDSDNTCDFMRDLV